MYFAMLAVRLDAETEQDLADVLAHEKTNNPAAAPARQPFESGVGAL